MPKQTLSTSSITNSPPHASINKPSPPPSHVQSITIVASPMPYPSNVTTILHTSAVKETPQKAISLSFVLMCILHSKSINPLFSQLPPTGSLVRFPKPPVYDVYFNDKQIAYLHPFLPYPNPCFTTSLTPYLHSLQGLLPRLMVVDTHITMSTHTYCTIPPLFISPQAHIPSAAPRDQTEPSPKPTIVAIDHAYVVSFPYHSSNALCPPFTL